MFKHEANHFILELYRAARQTPAGQFKPWVFERLHRLIEFDSGIWVTGPHVSGHDIHSVYLDNQPMAKMESHERFKDQDFLLREHLKNPGRTHNSNTLMPREQYTQLPIYKEHAHIYGIEHALSTAQCAPETTAITFISFYRADPEKPFTESERQLKETLTPHLVEAFTTNLFCHLHQPRQETCAHASAICSPGGALSQAEAHFVGFLHEEWPTWKGPTLPVDLINAFAPQETRFDGRRVQAAILPLNDLYHVILCHRSPLDVLSPRERSVAELLASGHPYKQIAACLSISPSTVTNHVNNIYQKLGIKSRGQLSHLCAPGV